MKSNLIEWFETMPNRLARKVAIVSGASKSISKAIAQLYAQQGTL